MKKSFKLLSLLVTVGMLAGCTVEVRPEKQSQPESTQESTTSQESQGGHSETTSETESQGGQSQESTESHESQGGSSQGGQSESQGGDSQTTESTSEGGQSQESQGGQSEESQGQESQGGESESTTPVKTPDHIVAEYDNEHGKVIVGDTLNTDYLTVDLYYSDNSHVSILESNDLSFTYEGYPVGPTTLFEEVGEHEIVAHYAPSSLASELTDTFTVNVVKRDVTSVEISAPKTNLETGESIDLTVTITPNNATIKDVDWTFDNTKLSIVNNKLTAGETPAANVVVYATVDGVKSNELTFQIVESHVAVTSITLSNTIKELEHHSSFDLTVTEFEPSNASDTEWLYTSSAPTVVSVDEHGHVEALQYSADPVTITVTNSWNEAAAACTVTVTKLAISSVTIARTDSAPINPNMKLGDTPVQLEAVVTPDKATDAGADVVWESSNEAVATVANGLLTPVAPGNADITAEVGGVKSEKVSITVAYADVESIAFEKDEVEFDISGEANLVEKATLSVLPANADQRLTYEVTDGPENGLTVAANGDLTPSETGIYTIRVTTVGLDADSQPKTKDIQVTVTNLYGTQTDPLSVDVAIEQAEALESGSQTTDIFFVEAVVYEVTDDARASHGNLTFTAKSSDGTKEFTFYRIKCGDAFLTSTFEAGQTVIVKGPLKKYNSTLEMVAGDFEQNLLAVDADTITGLTVAESAKEMVAGDKYQINATKLPEHSANAITYASNNEAAATVSNTGLVQAVAAGSANITVTAGDLHETVAITVNPAPELVSMSFSEDELVLNQKEEFVLTLDFVSDGGELSQDQMLCLFEIKDGSDDIITILEKEDGLHVTAKELEVNPAGLSATILATNIEKESVTAECHVTVSNKRVVSKEATYTVTGLSSVSSEGALSGSSATYSQTYSTAGQMTKDNSITLTLNGYAGTKIKSASVSVHSNSKAGRGTLELTSGDKTIASIEESAFNSENWHGGWSMSFVDVDLTITDPTYVIKSSDSIVLTISATANSLFFESLTIEYETFETIQYSFNVAQSLTGVSSTIENENTSVNRGGTFVATYEALDEYNAIDKNNVTVTAGDTAEITIDDTAVVGQVTVTVSNIFDNVTITVVTTKHAESYSITNSIDSESCEISNVKINNVLQGEGDTIPSQANDGEVLTFTVTPKTNYEFDDEENRITVTGGSESSVVTSGSSVNVSVKVTSAVTLAGGAKSTAIQYEEKTSTLTFTAACGGSGTADDGVVWTVTSDATESNYDSTKGIHYGTKSVAVSYLTLTTSSVPGTITEIVVNASGASSTSATLSVTVGEEAFGTTKNITSTATPYTFSGSKSGTIIVSLNQASATSRALYVKSITVTYKVPKA